MDFLFDTLFAHPGFYIGALLAGVAAIGFLLVVTNLKDISPAFTQRGHAEHLDHSRATSMWAFFLIVAAFAAWQVVRSVASWFGHGTANPYAAFWILGAVFIVWAFSYLRSQLGKKGGGH